MHPPSSIKFYYYSATDLIAGKINIKFIELVSKYGTGTHRVLVFISDAHEKIFRTKKGTGARIDLTSPPGVAADPKQAQSKAPWLFARES
jgi:hypothetical protein